MVQRKSHCTGTGNFYFNIHFKIDSIERIDLSPVDQHNILWLCNLFSYVALGKSLSLRFFIYKMGIISIL